MNVDYSLTDISTCSCSTCTCSNEYLEANYDCLTYFFIILYESSIWCMQIIYELFFKSFCQIIQELQDRPSDNKTIEGEDLSRYERHRDRRNAKEMDDSCIVVIPVRSSYCQTEINKNDIDLNQSTEPLCEISSRQNQISNAPSNNKPNSMLYHHAEQPFRSSTKLATNESFFSKRKQRRIVVDDNSIPLTLATSLHSNLSLDNVDYFLTKYIRQLLTDKHHLH